MATRILAAWYVSHWITLVSSFVDWFVIRYLVGQDSGYPAVNLDAWNLNAAVNTHVNVQANHAS